MLCLAAALLFSGCRESRKLEQVIYTQMEAPPDEENETKINDNQPEHEEKDEDLAAKAEDEESHTERDQEETEPVSGPEDETPEEAPEVRQEENSVNDVPAPAVPESETMPEPEIPPEETIDENPPAESETGTEQVETPAADPVSDISLRQVVDIYGSPVDVPENVNTVAAVGDSAQLVMMLGGEGRLAASSGSFTGNAMAQTVFAGNGIGGVSTLWSGDGGYGISDAAFEALLELSPDVCFAVSGVFSFSDEQLTRLRDQNIFCVTLPRLNTPGNLKTAVRIVGEVLGDRSGEGGTNAPEIAERYVDWHDGVLGRVGARVARFNYNDIVQWSPCQDHKSKKDRES